MPQRRPLNDASASNRRTISRRMQSTNAPTTRWPGASRHSVFPILTGLVHLLLLIVSPEPVKAQTVFVDGCYPAPGNGSLLSPYGTLPHAVSEASPGNTLVIRPGFYPSPITARTKLLVTAPAGPALVGWRYVGTAEICVPMTDDCGTLATSNPAAVKCSGDPPGARARLYYPASGPRPDSSVGCGGPFPVILYAHGNRSPNCFPCYSEPIENDYHQADAILRPLAAAGFIVVSLDVSWVNSGGAFFKASMLLNTLSFLRAENGRSGAMLHGSLDMSRVGLAGHSTGGAAALDALVLLEVGSCSRLNLNGVLVGAAALLAPGLDALPNTCPPLLVFYGTTDSGQVGDHPLQVYARANGPKHLVSITGANHYGYTDALCCLQDFDGPCQVGGAIGDGARRRQQLAARDYLIAFFHRYLRDDLGKSDYLLQSTGRQCAASAPPPDCGPPRRRFHDLTALGVEVGVCSCVP
jgi:dienelactone hydrolase